MIKCEVVADRVSLIVHKGSIVLVDEMQYELARQFIKPVSEEEKPKRKAKKD